MEHPFRGDIVIGKGPGMPEFPGVHCTLDGHQALPDPPLPMGCKRLAGDDGRPAFCGADIQREPGQDFGREIPLEYFF